MSKHLDLVDRSQLPEGWHWADWSKAADSKEFWKNFDVKAKPKMRQRLAEVSRCKNAGRPLPHEKYYVDRGIGLAKIKSPNPGWRAWTFRDGKEYFVTHITKKDPKNDHEKQIKIALKAKDEHLRKKQKQRDNNGKKNRRSGPHKRSSGRSS